MTSSSEPAPGAREASAPSAASPRNLGDRNSPSSPHVDNPSAGLDERTPLLSSNIGDQDGLSDGTTRHGDVDDSQTTKSVWYLILLTIGIGGLQVAWSVEMSNGSPYLLSLGLSKSLMALVWIAGPLTGTLVQPYVGMLSDNCRLPWGKRKPFMVGGSLATVLSLLFLAWTKEIVAGILGLFGAHPESEVVKTTTIIAAVIGVYVLDFAINTVQAAIRAFIVDCAPAHQQEAANAMASRILGFGNIVGYIAGYSDLPKYLWFLGRTQFQILCAIASIFLSLTVMTSLVIPERDPRLEGPVQKNRPNVLSFFFNIFTSIRRLPPQIKRVCEVQFFAWIGFFPLLFYSSSYIGEIYAEPYLQENPHMTPAELDELYERATRIGTFALLVNSIVSLCTNVFLPFFIAPTYDSQPITAASMSGETDVTDMFDEGKPSLLDYLRIPGFTLKRAWFASLVLFGVSMFCTVIVQTVEAATAIIGLVGITWAMTLWAPYAIISAEISRRDALIRARRIRRLDLGSNADTATSSALGGQLNGSTGSEDEEIDQAGVILGIHNMSIAAPQIIATVGSSIIFKIWQKPRGTPGDHSISVVLALGGACVLVSSFFVAAIRDDPSLPADAMISTEQGQDRPKSSRSRRSSFERLARASQGRAALTRNKSFSGAEMN